MAISYPNSLILQQIHREISHLFQPTYNPRNGNALTFINGSGFKAIKPLSAVSINGGGEKEKSVKCQVFNETEWEADREVRERDGYSSMEKEAHFVRWFREAWPYFKAHRDGTFVIIISGEMVDSAFLDPILKASHYLYIAFLLFVVKIMF